MNVMLILVSTLMISATTNVVSGSFWREFRNSYLDHEVMIEGSKAEEIYLTEQSDQTKELQKLKEKNEKLEAKIKTGKSSVTDKESRTLNSFGAEAYRLNQEAREKDFCQEENTCQRAFKNTFFSKKSFTRNWEANAKTRCVPMKIIARKAGEPFTTTERQLVQCDITSKSGISKVFLAPSTKYDPEKNLKFFALVEENGNAKPIAYLMNKKEPKPKMIRSESAVLRDITAGGTASGIASDILSSISDGLRYTYIFPGPIINF